MFDDNDEIFRKVARLEEDPSGESIDIEKLWQKMSRRLPASVRQRRNRYIQAAILVFGVFMLVTVSFLQLDKPTQPEHQPTKTIIYTKQKKIGTPDTIKIK
jgi:hypothetical protein